MYYPKLVYANFTIEGVFLFGILCLSNKIYGLESLYHIGNFQIIHMEEPNKSHWETPLVGGLNTNSRVGRYKEMLTSCLRWVQDRCACGFQNLVGTSVYGGHTLSPLGTIGLRKKPKHGGDQPPFPFKKDLNLQIHIPIHLPTRFQIQYINLS